MTITDPEILHKIIETQGCVIQGRSLKALFHKNAPFYLDKSGADIITVYMNEHETVNIEYILEHHRHFAHLVKKYIYTKKKLAWDTFVKRCASHFNGSSRYRILSTMEELFAGLLSHREAQEFTEELQMQEAVMMPIYAFDPKVRIGYVCFLYKTKGGIDLERLESVRVLFQTLLQPLYDTNQSTVYYKCARVNENMGLLTEQEKRIVRKVLGGHTYPDIAETLGISINTLKTHMKHIFNKYNVTSKIELNNKLSALP